MGVLLDFFAYFKNVVEDRRKNPTDDLASVLANLSGAMAVSWPGNSGTVDASILVKGARYLLKAVSG